MSEPKEHDYCKLYTAVDKMQDRVFKAFCAALKKELYWGEYELIWSIAEHPEEAKKFFSKHIIDLAVSVNKVSEVIQALDPLAVEQQKKQEKE